jgi:glyoxylase-like metal-dependent hydrolase (beta-lactamase superfamily II)
MEGDLYLKQLQLGPMMNYVYLIGSATTREVAVVDPAWEIDRIVALANAEDLTISALLVSHHHMDHTNGILPLMEQTKAKVYINKNDAEFVKGLNPSSSDVVKVESGEELKLGEFTVRFIHTPGHTPGSQCFHVENNLVSGDTLFIGSCGRCDLPGSDPEQMYFSLQRLAKLDPQTALYPGHNYALEPTSTIGVQVEENPFLQIPSVQQFVSLVAPSRMRWRGY